jgi:hypothetical protein
MADTTDEMEQRCCLLTSRALVITEEGPLTIQSKEEVKSIIMHHFGIRKHELHIYRSYPEPFLVLFSEIHDRDLVFAVGKVIEGPFELGFHSWELDRFGDRQIIPYHVRLCIEGIPHHAWSKQLADKVLCDEALIHHVEEDTMDRYDQRTFNCWAFTKDPSRIPQSVFLSLLTPEVEIGNRELVQLSRRAVKKCHVFKVFIHIDVVEDLLFYHHPREELIAGGKVP